MRTHEDLTTSALLCVAHPDLTFFESSGLFVFVLLFNLTPSANCTHAKRLSIVENSQQQRTDQTRNGTRARRQIEKGRKKSTRQSKRKSNSETQSASKRIERIQRRASNVCSELPDAESAAHDVELRVEHVIDFRRHLRPAHDSRRESGKTRLSKNSDKQRRELGSSQ